MHSGIWHSRAFPPTKYVSGSTVQHVPNVVIPNFTCPPPPPPEHQGTEVGRIRGSMVQVKQWQA